MNDNLAGKFRILVRKMLKWLNTCLSWSGEEVKIG